MRSNKVAAAILLFLAAIFTFHFLGLRYDWYHSLWWYDIPMHIAGGAWVASAFLYSARKYELVARAVRPTSLRVLGVTLAIGIGWELFEYSMDVYVFFKYTFSTVPIYILIDSMYDLSNDLLGAFLVVVLAKTASRKSYRANRPI